MHQIPTSALIIYSVLLSAARDLNPTPYQLFSPGSWSLRDSSDVVRRDQDVENAIRHFSLSNPDIRTYYLLSTSH